MTVKKERGPQKGPLKGFGGSWKGLGLEGTWASDGSRRAPEGAG